MHSEMEIPSYSVFDDRRKLMAWVYLVSGIALIIFIIIHLLQGCCYRLSVVEGLLVLVMFFSFWHTRKGDDIARIEYLFMGSAVVLFSSLVFLESLEDSGAFWIAGFPFLAYFVHQVEKARYWVAFFIIELFLAALMVSLGWLELPYTAAQLFCLIAIVLFFWVCAHNYQFQIEYRQKLLEASYLSLEEQQSRLQVILDHSPVGIWMVDEKYQVQFLNKTWMGWCGVSERQVKNVDDYSALLPAAAVQQMRDSDEACLSGNETCYVREELLCSDGVAHTLDFIRVRLTTEDGLVTGLVGFAIDITEKLQAEKEQRALERQVQHSQRLESLGVMAGGIAHDFNNLLTAIQGSIELAKLEQGLSVSMLDSLSCMDAATHAATDLCRQMLAYSGKGLLKPELLNFHDLIEEMRPLLDVSIGKDITLEYQYDQGISDVFADRSQISQVLLNLVINASEAIGASLHGQIKISVQRQQLEAVEKDRFSGAELKPGCYAMLTVQDNGIGMTAETLEHMFDPFFTTKFTGRGLGLSAILGILRAHEAGLEVDSESGRGTSMSVWFPCDCRSIRSTQKQQSSGADMLSGRVLLVDDEPGVIQVASRMLERLGLQVVSASNGREAVDIFLQDQNFDWVLLDVTMPEMDGAECLEKLRAIKPDIYVAMTSGYDPDSVLNASRICQPNDFLTKPYIMDTLRQVVERAPSGMSNQSA